MASKSRSIATECSGHAGRMSCWVIGKTKQPRAKRCAMAGSAPAILAEQLPYGSLRIIGLLDDQITLSTGYKVAPLELANRLADDPWIEQWVLVGQDRPFIAALVHPRMTRVPSVFFDQRSESSMDASALAAAIVERLRPRTSDLPRSMQIERIAVLTDPLTVENGGLNFKGAVRRRFVEQVLCRQEVERLYNEPTVCSQM